MKNLIKIILAIVMVALVSGASLAEQTYTGLIVDARELGVDPGTSPKIYDKKGREIYGTVNIDPDLVIEKGIVQYYNTIAEAIIDGTVGDNPIVVRASGRGPHPYKADVTISVEDANWILKANSKSYFLQGLKVVFVL